jgi:hypothetical protein
MAGSTGATKRGVNFVYRIDLELGVAEVEQLKAALRDKALEEIARLKSGQKLTATPLEEEASIRGRNGTIGFFVRGD